jgi:hypothetical protein
MKDMKRLFLGVCLAVSLAGCAASSGMGGASNIGQISAEERAVRERADYWQRSDSISALYLTGPKAQHQLNMDLAACVAEVKELVRLGSIRRASPPPGLAMEPGMRQGWDSPTRDGPLYTEYTDFQDFDGCMYTKGWSRVNYVRPMVAQGAAANYVTTILGHPVGWGGGSSYSSSGRVNSVNQNFNR